MVVSSANGDFTLTFDTASQVHIHRDGKLTLSLFDTEVESLFHAIADGFSIMGLGKMVDVIPALGGRTAFGIEAQEGEVYLKQVNVSEPDPIPTLSGHEDNPEIGYILRHEYKDLYLTPDDMHHDRREYTGPRDKAHVFPTNYSAVRFMQGIKHATTCIEIPTAFIVTWRTTENSERHYYDGELIGSLKPNKALKMDIRQAGRVAETLPGQFIITVEKVAK